MIISKKHLCILAGAMLGANILLGLALVFDNDIGDGNLVCRAIK